MGGLVSYLARGKGEGVFELACIDVRTARARIGNEVGTVRRAVGADFVSVGGELLRSYTVCKVTVQTREESSENKLGEDSL